MSERSFAFSIILISDHILSLIASKMSSCRTRSTVCHAIELPIAAPLMQDETAEGNNASQTLATQVSEISCAFLIFVTSDAVDGEMHTKLNGFVRRETLSSSFSDSS
jgi:hypothetical protein